MARREALIEHLLRRAGFGGTASEVDESVELGYAATLERLLREEEEPDTSTMALGRRPSSA